MSNKVAVGVLVSGGGTNLQALIDACAHPDYPAKIAVVISNKPDAYALTRAQNAGIATSVCRPREYSSKGHFEQAMVATLLDHQVGWVALAGFMRLLSTEFLSAFPKQVLNIHPSLLPAYPGLHAQRQALERGARISGASVHFVDEGCDTGSVIAQGAVPVLPTDHLEDLQSRILKMEHRVYPMALRWAVEGKVKLTDTGIVYQLSPGDFPSLFDPNP